MADDRAARKKALDEKKRRLEEIKARRRGVAAAGDDVVSTATSSAANGNLDSYIDELLKTSTPGIVSIASEEYAAATVTASTTVEKQAAEATRPSPPTAAVERPSSSAAPVESSSAAASMKAVETFEIAIQCEEDDFPPPSLIDEEESKPSDGDSDHDDDDEAPAADDDDGEGQDGNNKGGISASSPSRNNNNNDDGQLNSSFSLQTAQQTVEPLTDEEKSKLLSSQPFSHFLSTASKRVERLLGASSDEGMLFAWGGGMSGFGGGGGIDYAVDYATDGDEEYYSDDEAVADGVGSNTSRMKKRRNKKSQQKAPYQQGGFFTTKSTYEFARWTQGRDVTDIEWCPSHKEWVLASYNSVSGALGGGGSVVNSGAIRNTEGGEASGVKEALASYYSSNNNNPSTRYLSPREPSSSFLQNSNPQNTNSSSSSSSYTIPNEGIISIYNLLMPERPEHIFCSGCPILHSQFHPTEHPKLVLGGASSGQILVWDARVGRYPVQRSSVTSGGHDCELVGMKVLSDGGAAAGGGAGGSMSTSKLVTASSDGKINYWSVSNLREPVEYVTVNANLSCLDVLPYGNEGVVCGDERGGVHAVFAGSGTSAAASATSSSSKRVVRTLYSGGGGGGLATTASPLDDELDNLEEEKVDMGHYGMVTSVSTRPYMTPSNTPRSSKESTDASSGGMSKGFLRGAGGLVVTTGVDWSTKLWAPAYSDLPLMSFLSSSYDYMCDAQWSPVHPSVFATASSNGTLSLWNLATSLDQPVSGTDGIPIDNLAAGGDSSRRGLNRLKWSADGRRMAVASGDKLHVLGVGEDIWKSKGDEESRVMNNLVSRGFIQEV